MQALTQSGTTITSHRLTSIWQGTTITSYMWRAYGGIARVQGMGSNYCFYLVDPQMQSWKSTKERNEPYSGTNRHMLGSYLRQWIWWQRHRYLDLFDHILDSNAAYWQLLQYWKYSENYVIRNTVIRKII